MKLRVGIFIIVLIGAFGCTKEWEDHYDQYPETVNQNVWEAMKSDPSISDFVQALQDNQLDTLFKNSDNSYTVFAPTNDAFSQYLQTNTVDTTLLKYHIAAHFIQSGNITGKRKVQTMTKKFALFDRSGSNVTVDGKNILSESPLYINGKYYTLDEVAAPLPNFYEFFAINNPVLKSYIDSQDSIILDKERSKPIGFDENGNTIYDTVSVTFNKFEAKYFPVTDEFRNITGTIVFPRKDDYENALTEMALNMQTGYTSFEDIPLDWQYTILMPHLLKQGVFLNMLEPEEFAWKSPKDTTKLQNIMGDSIPIFYTPVDKTILSNGYTYNYQDFVIPDSLYMGRSVFEGERLLRKTGVNKHNWREIVTVDPGIQVQPVQEFIPEASNDSILRLIFPKGYSGKYNIEFESQFLFPRKYVMAIRTHMDIGGLYNIYVNDELMQTPYSSTYAAGNTFDYYEFIRRRGLIMSVTGARYLPVGRFNSFDMYVDNITEYSRAKIRIEYKGPGIGTPSNGLVIDYIEFIPATQ